MEDNVFIHIFLQVIKEFIIFMRIFFFYNFLINYEYEMIIIIITTIRYLKKNKVNPKSLLIFLAWQS